MDLVTGLGLAGAVYVGAGAVLFVLVWIGTRYLPGRNLRLFLRAVCLAMLATPWHTGLEQGQLAPAAIVGAFAFMDTGWRDALLAIQSLLGVLLVVALVVLMKSVIERRRGAGRRTARGAESEPQEPAAAQSKENKET